MLMNLRRTAALLQSICPPKLELAALGGIRFCSSVVKPDENKALLVDTLAQRLEAQGLPTKQAEAITSMVSEILNDCLQNAVHSMQKRSESLQDFKLSNFKLEVQSSFEHRLSLLLHEKEKLKVHSEKMDIESRSYILEKFVEHELGNMETTAKLDRDITELRVQLEATKLKVVKYCIGTMFSIAAVGLALDWLKM